MIQWCTTLKAPVTLELLKEKLPYNYYKRLFVNKDYNHIFNNPTHQYFFPNFERQGKRGRNTNIILDPMDGSLHTNLILAKTIPDVTIKQLGVHVIKNNAMTVNDIDYTLIEKDEFNSEIQLTYKKDGKTIVKLLSECNTPEYSYLINYLELKETGVCKKLK